MNRTKSNKIQYFVMAIIGILLFVSLLINTSLAYFTDSAQINSETTLQFGVIDVVTDIENGEPTTVDEGTIKFLISATEVASMDDVKRTLVLKSPNTEVGTLPFYVRMNLNFYKDNVLNNSLATVSISNSSAGYTDSVLNYLQSNWKTGSDGKYYYNQAVDVKTNGPQYIPLVLHFEDAFGEETFHASDKLYIEVIVEVIQQAHDGYTGWTERPVNWPQV